LTLTIDTIIFFILLSLFASTVNGGLGYGYSSISVPLAILLLASRVINPAYALLEVLLNITVLLFVGRKNISTTIGRSFPIILSIVPGVIVGSLVLSEVASLWVKFLAYLVLLPLILLQVAGFTRPIKSEGKASLPLGLGTGILYSLTTISGPPLALFWNNQGLNKEEFRAAVAEVRVAESSFTVVAYYFLGLFNAPTVALFSIVSPPVLVGIPLGMFLVRKVSVETFRRIAMNFDAWIVGYGLSRTVVSGFGATDYFAYFFWSSIVFVDLALFYRFLKTRKVVKREIPAFPAIPEHGGVPSSSAGLAALDEIKTKEV
jgi:uncharacterized membrane protein YfcA